MKISKVRDLISILSNNGETLTYIWGCGAYGNLLGQLLNSERISWEAYYDNYYSDIEIGLNGKKIYKGDSLKNKNAIHIISMRAYESIYDQLTDYGVCDDYIIFFDMKFYRELEKNNGYTKDLERKVASIKDNYKGESCFIVGNGPSLNKEDLETIYNSEIKSFGCNLIYRSFSETSWRPNFYFFSDENVIRLYLKDVPDPLINSGNILLFLRCDSKLVSEFKGNDRVIFFNELYSDNRDNIMFSYECEKQVYVGYTVSYIMLQMAFFMGFKEIYLVGIDHSFSNEIKNNRLIKTYKQDHSTLLKGMQSPYYEIDITTKAYEEARKAADKHGVKIYNATRGGKLEVFERVDFDSLF